ncbi:MAG: glycosyltransferase [Actinobacteria bacterium]|nr:glycosyltransferase [Chloroflexota bacterium]MBE3128176.1 glycosyltransferase [Actinomycetota bacterium]
MVEVSIVIPAYNQDKFLGETLKSVLAQTFKDFECIIIDDGSTDKTKDIAGKYSDGARVKYFYQENKGLAGARNTGIKLARGKYINFLDSDDLIYEYFLEHMVKKLDSHSDIDFLSCAWELIDEKGKKISSKIGPARSNNYLEDLILQNLFPVQAIMLKKSIFDDIGMFNENLSALEDWDMWLRVATKNYRFDVLDEVGVSYRRHKKGMTLDIKRMTDNLYLFLDNFYQNNPNNIKYRQYAYLFQILNIYLYAEEAGNGYYQGKIIKEVYGILDSTDYNHYYFKKVYELVRNIKNKKIKIGLVRSIYHKAPIKYKNFWRVKNLKMNIKNLLNL